MNNPFLVSVARTLVPALWSVLIVWLVAHGLPADLAATLSPLAETVILPFVLAGYYALIRWLETQAWWPALLSQVLMGSAHVPDYDTGDHDPRPDSVTVDALVERVERESAAE